MNDLNPPAFNTPLLPDHEESIRFCVECLNHHNVVAIPSETVYGLAGNAFSEIAIRNIFEAKKRPSFDPLIVHVSSHIFADPQGPLTALVKKGILHPELLEWPLAHQINSAMTHYWPGPLTLVLPKGVNIPDSVTSQQDTVGIRMPDHRIFQAILQKLPYPLAAPSANLFGSISPTTAEHVYRELNGRISAIIDGGACSVGVESSILGIQKSATPELASFQFRLLRPGKIGIQELASFFNHPIEVEKTVGQKNQALQAPGMLEQHYAPKKRLFLSPFSFNNTPSMLSFLAHLQNTFYPSTRNPSVGFLCLHQALPEDLKKFAAKTYLLSPTNHLQEMAQNLFSFLRALDEDPKVSFICSEIPPQNEGIGMAIRDRLQRASFKI